MSDASCPKCGAEQQDRGDFCRNLACREYLAWDVPPMRRRVPPKAPEERDEQQDPREATAEKATAAITLLGEDTQRRPRKASASRCGHACATRAR
jgi:hypothetical protein